MKRNEVHVEFRYDKDHPVMNDKWKSKRVRKNQIAKEFEQRLRSYGHGDGIGSLEHFEMKITPLRH